MSVAWRAPEKKKPHLPALVLAFRAWPFALNDPPYPEASRWNPPEGIRVLTFTTAAILPPYSASHPPVWKSIWFTTCGSNSSFKLPEMPEGTGTPST